jgi:hypothetical protein
LLPWLFNPTCRNIIALFQLAGLSRSKSDPFNASTSKIICTSLHSLHRPRLNIDDFNAKIHPMALVLFAASTLFSSLFSQLEIPVGPVTITTQIL